MSHSATAMLKTDRSLLIKYVASTILSSLEVFVNMYSFNSFFLIRLHILHINTSCYVEEVQSQYIFSW